MREPRGSTHDGFEATALFGTWDARDAWRWAVFEREQARELSRRASLPPAERERDHANRLAWFSRCDPDDPNMTLVADENHEHAQVERLAAKRERARAERLMARPAVRCRPPARRPGRRTPRRTLRRRVRRTSRARDGDGGDGESDGPRSPCNLTLRDAASLGGAP
jgi:hypothetical protein